MKIAEIRELTKDESVSKIIELRKELAKERALIASGTKPENPGKIKGIRRTIARLMTSINEKNSTKEDVKSNE